MLETQVPGHDRSSATRLRVTRWVAVLVIVTAVVSSAMWLLKSRAAIPANTTVLIGPFENNTGEPVLDGTLQFALERELINSQSIHVVSPERVQDILQRCAALPIPIWTVLSRSKSAGELQTYVC